MEVLVIDKTSDVQRSLGRIEGVLEQLRDEMRNSNARMHEEFSAHKQDDQIAMSAIHLTLKELRETREKKWEIQDERLGVLEKSCDGLQEVNRREEKRAETVGKWVLLISGALFTLVGGLALRLFGKYFKMPI